MKDYITTVTVEDKRKKGKTFEEDVAGVIARLKRAYNADAADLGLSALKLRDSDRDKIVAAVQKEIDRLTRGTSPQNSDAAVARSVENPVARPVEKPAVTGPVERLDKILSSEEQTSTLSALKERLENMSGSNTRHISSFETVKEALLANPEAMWSVAQMEKKGHEPCVYHSNAKGFYIGTFSEKSPQSTRNCTYDGAVEMAKAMGLSLMTLEQYKALLGLTVKQFDGSPLYVWLLSEETRESGKVQCATRNEYAAFVLERRPELSYDVLGWRGSLMVPYASSNKCL